MKKMIIIGAGISGLTAGIKALEKGYDTTIYEKNCWAGGCCTGWVRDGYYIDNCMHWLTGTNQNTKDFKLWKKIGALDETSNLYQSEYFYKSFDNNQSITLYADLEKTRQEMLTLSPIDKKEINKFINTIKKISKSMQSGNIITNLYNKALGYTTAYFRYHNLSLDEYVKRYHHPLLKKLFTDYIPGNYSPLFLFCSYATFASGNGKIYQNGSKEFSDNILKTYEEKGGKIFFNSNVTKIYFDKSSFIGIEIDGSKKIYGDFLIYTADPYFLYEHLIDNNLTYQPLLEKLKKNINSPTMSSFHVAYLYDGKDLPFKDTVIHEIKKIKVGKKEINRLIIRDYSYLYKNQDKTIFQVFISQSNVDYQYWFDLDKNSHEEYLRKKELIGKDLLDIIEEIYPSLKNKTKVLDTWTPLTYNNYFNSHNGSYMGYVFGKKAPLTSISPKIKNIKNMLVTTYWQKMTGGLPTALRNGNDIGHLI